MTVSGWLRDPRYDAGLGELARLDAAEAALFASRCRVLSALAVRTSREGWQGEAPFDSLVLDVAGTCLLGQVAAGSRLLDAEHLVVRLPQALAALESGDLRVPQAQVLVEQTRTLAPGVCAEVQRRVLPLAGDLCPADLRRLVKRVVLEVDAEAVSRREAEARRSRRTWVRPAEDGMALLCALLPAEQAQAALAGLTEQARQARLDGDGRSTDQLRADLLVSACTAAPAAATPGAAPPLGTRRRSGRPVRVVVHVPLGVARGLSDAPADLEGYGPISAVHARRLLAGAELQRACADPDTGRVWALDDEIVAPEHVRDGRLDHGTSVGQPADDAGRGRSDDVLRRRHLLDAALRQLADRPPPPPLPPEPQHDPSAALSRVVRARDTRCDGPGCSLPAARCELDHDRPWPAGGTSEDNLVVRSQRCHHAKHAGWAAERTAAGTAWTSPGGRRHVVPHRRGLPAPAEGAAPWAKRAAALAERGLLLLRVHELLPEPPNLPEPPARPSGTVFEGPATADPGQGDDRVPAPF